MAAPRPALDAVTRATLADIVVAEMGIGDGGFEDEGYRRWKRVSWCEICELRHERKM